MDRLYDDRRSEISRRVDIANHSRVAHRDLYQLIRMRFEEPFRACIAPQRLEFRAEPARDPHWMSAPRAKVRRGERCAPNERIPQRGDRARAYERHVGERDEVGVRWTCCVGGMYGTYRAGKACAHALSGVFAHHDLAAFPPQEIRKLFCFGADSDENIFFENSL